MHTNWRGPGSCASQRPPARSGLSPAVTVRIRRARARPPARRRRSPDDRQDAKAHDGSEQCYATGMSDAQVPPPPASATTPDTKALIRTIVGTGIGLGTLLLMLIGLMLQQNAAVNTRIDDLNVSVNARFGDVNARIDDVTANVNARIDDVNANMNARFDDLRSDINRRFDDVQADIREIRAMLSELLKGDTPAAD